MDYSITLTEQMVALVPVVAIILQVLKNVKALQKIKEWFPFVSIGVALGLCYLYKIPDPAMPSVLIGLVASGSYDAFKKISGTTADVAK